MAWSADAPSADTADAETAASGARMHAPPMNLDVREMLVSAVELTLDTSSWTVDTWSELDAVALIGLPVA